MIIANAIVAEIHSKDPPGRFLKKCSDTGQWLELSKRKANDKAAQAIQDDFMSNETCVSLYLELGGAMNLPLS